MDTQPVLTRKRIIAIVSLLAAMWLVFWLVGYLKTGTIVINTNSADNQIVISDNTGKILKQGYSHLSARLKKGIYIAEVSQKQASAKQSVRVIARQTKTYNINPALFSNPEPITGSLIKSLAASDGNLTYFDSSINKLVMVDSSGTPRYISLNPYQSIKWSSPLFGIGQYDNGNLFVINNGSISDLGLPPGFNPSNGLGFAPGPNNKIYVSSGRDVYVYEGSSYKKIYAAGSPAIQILPSPSSNLAVIETYTGGEDHPEVTAKIVVLSAQGDVISRHQTLASDSLDAHINLAWSPSGKRLLLSNTGEGSSVYDAKFNKIRDLPDNTSSSAYWLTDNELLYSVDNSLWGYSLENNLSNVVAQILDGSSINEMAVDTVNKQVYLASGTAERGVLYRSGLQASKYPDLSYKLAVFLPVNGSGCYANYLNITKPTVVLLPFNPNSLGPCRQSINSLLVDSAINPNSISFISDSVLVSSGG